MLVVMLSVYSEMSQLSHGFQPRHRGHTVNTTWSEVGPSRAVAARALPLSQQSWQPRIVALWALPAPSCAQRSGSQCAEAPKPRPCALVRRPAQLPATWLLAGMHTAAFCISLPLHVVLAASCTRGCGRDCAFHHGVYGHRMLRAAASQASPAYQELHATSGSPGAAAGGHGCSR